MTRKHLFRSWPDGHGSLGRLRRVVEGAGIDPALLELVRLRASQLNGCEYCVEKHTADALAAGESPERLAALASWPQAPLFSARDRAALAFTEAVTLVADHDRMDRGVAEASAVFSPEELTRLLYAVIEINAWNRLAVTTGSPAPATSAPGPVEA